MKRHLGAFEIAALLLVSLFAAEAALAQKPGGILKMYTVDSPASMSILETVDSTIWLPKGHAQGLRRRPQPCGKRARPDQNLYLLYGCGGDLNYNGYCNPELDRLIDRQSIEADTEKRKQLVCFGTEPGPYRIGASIASILI
jgi:hypothetical protein